MLAKINWPKWGLLAVLCGISLQALLAQQPLQQVQTTSGQAVQGHITAYEPMGQGTLYVRMPNGKTKALNRKQVANFSALSLPQLNWAVQVHRSLLAQGPKELYIRSASHVAVMRRVTNGFWAGASVGMHTETNYFFYPLTARVELNLLPAKVMPQGLRTFVYAEGGYSLQGANWIANPEPTYTYYYYDRENLEHKGGAVYKGGLGLSYHLGRVAVIMQAGYYQQSSEVRSPIPVAVFAEAGSTFLNDIGTFPSADYYAELRTIRRLQLGLGVQVKL